MVRFVIPLFAALVAVTTFAAPAQASCESGDVRCYLHVGDNHCEPGGDCLVCVEDVPPVIHKACPIH